MNNEVTKDNPVSTDGQVPPPPPPKPPLTPVSIEAFAKPTNTYTEGDSHILLVTGDRTYCWPNFSTYQLSAQGFHIDPQSRQQVCATIVYKELMLEFANVPHLRLPHASDLHLGINGLCSQLANRQLLFGEGNVDICGAPGCHVNVALFGKYGIALQDLKELIKKTYDKVGQRYQIPEGALESTLSKVDDHINEEEKAWESLFKNNLKMPWDNIKSKKPAISNTLQTMLQDLINNREGLYNGLQNKSSFNGPYKDMLKDFVGRFIDKLHQEDLISGLNAVIYKGRGENLLRKFFENIEKQRRHFRRRGALNHNLASSGPTQVPIYFMMYR